MRLTPPSPSKSLPILAAALIALAPLAGLAAQPPGAPPAGSKYVAMGSSYAAGPGITTSADTPPNRCTRSKDNYPQQIARAHGLMLVDVSCSGAVTAHILGPWNELKPQLDALDKDTRLVTVTIGGNDVDYTRGLGALSCQTAAAAAPPGTTPRRCPEAPPAHSEKDWADLETHMTQIATEVRARAPAARLVFVDYVTVLPPTGTCPALSLTADQADAMRQTFRRVAEITARVARASGAGLIPDTLTAEHNACSADPWANGARVPPPVDGAAFHPRLAAHTAIAKALERLIWG